MKQIRMSFLWLGSLLILSFFAQAQQEAAPPHEVAPPSYSDLLDEEGIISTRAYDTGETILFDWDKGNKGANSKATYFMGGEQTYLFTHLELVRIEKVVKGSYGNYGDRVYLLTFGKANVGGIGTEPIKVFVRPTEAGMIESVRYSPGGKKLHIPEEQTFRFIPEVVHVKLRSRAFNTEEKVFNPGAHIVRILFKIPGKKAPGVSEPKIGENGNLVFLSISPDNPIKMPFSVEVFSRSETRDIGPKWTSRAEVNELDSGGYTVTYREGLFYREGMPRDKNRLEKEKHRRDEVRDVYNYLKSVTLQK